MEPDGRKLSSYIIAEYNQLTGNHEMRGVRRRRSLPRKMNYCQTARSTSQTCINASLHSSLPVRFELDDVLARHSDWCNAWRSFRNAIDLIVDARELTISRSKEWLRATSRLSSRQLNTLYQLYDIAGQL